MDLLLQAPFNGGEYHPILSPISILFQPLQRPSLPISERRLWAKPDLPFLLLFHDEDFIMRSLKRSLFAAQNVWSGYRKNRTSWLRLNSHADSTDHCYWIGILELWVEKNKRKKSFLSAFDIHYSNNPTFQYSMVIRAQRSFSRFPRISLSLLEGFSGSVHVSNTAPTWP